MELKNEYFTPDISDIRVEYECEINVNGRWLHHIIGGIEAFRADDWYNLDMVQRENGTLNNYIRVPFLTNEQIEAKGWSLDYSRHVTPGVIYQKDDYTLWKIGNTIWIRKGDNDETIYKGECKDINTLRYISKLLNI